MRDETERTDRVNGVDRTDGVRIGRLFGITLTLDHSWVFIFALMAIELAAYFMTAHSDWSAAGAMVVAVVSAGVFFLSVLAHEYGHALVAKRFHRSVREVRLFLFGGVSNVEREPPSPRVELLMAIAGPLVSFTIGLLAIGLTMILLDTRSFARADDFGGAIGRSGGLKTILLWIGPLNVFIGLFNLLPGFPLDGGRVLRALLWKVTGDLRTATRWAAVAGQVVGWLFVALGIAMVFGAKIPFVGGHGGWGVGVWIALVGWFVRTAAVNSYRGLAVEELRFKPS